MRSSRLSAIALPLACAGVVLAGCTALSGTEASPGVTESAISPVATIDGDLSADAVLAANADIAVLKDDEWDVAAAVDVVLDGTAASSDSGDVRSADGTVTISAAGVYRLTGLLTGSVVIDAPNDAQVVLVLDGVEITNELGAAIDVRTADDVAIVTGEGSVNTVTDASTAATEAEADAAIFAAADLTVSGAGALTVTSGGNDGIASSDDLVILGGTLTVHAADDGLRGKDALRIAGGTVTVSAGSDGLKSNQADDAAAGFVVIDGGAVTIDAGDDGIDAATDVIVTGGVVEATAGGGASAAAADASPHGIAAGVVIALDGGEIGVDAGGDAIHSDGSIGFGGAVLTAAAADDGVHAESGVEVRDGVVKVTRSTEALEAADISVSGGTVDLVATDDGINAAGGASATDAGGMADTGESVVISGGTVTVDAEGDGIDVNGSLTVSGGVVTVAGPTGAGNGALDANGAIEVSGGTLIAFGSSGMAQAPDESSSQQWIAAEVSGGAGDVVTVLDERGATLASFTATKSFGTLVVSTDALVDGATYSVTVGDAVGQAVTEGTPFSGGRR